MAHHENRLAYQGKVEALLKQWGSQINTWQQSADEEMQPHIQELNQKRQAVRAKLEELRSTDDDHWQDARQSMEESVEAMEQAIDRSQRQFHQT